MNKTKKAGSWTKSIVATAAALLLVIGGTVAFGQYQAYAVSSVVTLDVNPSIELKLNKDELVLSATGLNEDGLSLLVDAELEGKSIQDAASEILKAMTDAGYISDIKNAILVSVKNKDTTKSDELKKALEEKLSGIFAENGIDGLILSQKITESKELRELANMLGVSDGKAKLIKDLVNAEPAFSKEKLADLKLSDLSVLAEKWQGSLDELSIKGKLSDKSSVEEISKLISGVSDMTNEETLVIAKEIVNKFVGDEYDSYFDAAEKAMPIISGDKKLAPDEIGSIAKETVGTYVGDEYDAYFDAAEKALPVIKGEKELSPEEAGVIAKDIVNKFGGDEYNEYFDAAEKVFSSAKGTK